MTNATMTGKVWLLLVALLIPVSALLLGVVVLGERPEPAAFAGLALILAGLMAVDGRAVDGRAVGWRRRRGREGAQ